MIVDLRNICTLVPTFPRLRFIRLNSVQRELKRRGLLEICLFENSSPRTIYFDFTKEG